MPNSEYKPADHDTLLEQVEHIESLAALMDSKFSLPGTDIGLGLDVLIGLIPVIGDTVGLSVSSYIVYRAKKLGVRRRTLSRMVFNIGIDWLIGLVPVIGDIFDVGWKANNRNAALVRKHYERNLPNARASRHKNRVLPKQNP